MSVFETDVGGVEKMIDDRMKVSFQAHKDDLLKDIGTLFEKISGQSNASQLNKLTCLIPSDVPKFKRKGNEEQFQVNAKLSQKLCEAEGLCDNYPAQAKLKITEAKDMLAHRQKLIQLADSSEHGWRLVSEYESNPLADDSEDERRIYKAEARVSRKLKAEHAKKPKHRAVPYRKADTRVPAAATATAPIKHGLCFKCGQPGHWKNDCLGSRNSNNKMSMHYDYLCKPLRVSLFGMTHDKDNTVKHSGPSFAANENTSSPPVLSPVGRLKAKADRWRSATDSLFILDVISKGYKLPLKTSPSGIILKNNKSARDHPDFVESEICSLQEKGVISLTNDVPFVVNPLTVAFNRKNKPRLVLDCRHINSHLHLFKVKFEDINVAESIFLPGTYLFTFDLKSAYHHIDIHLSHRTFLGFSWNIGGKTSYYVYNALPFGIASAGHIFTKVLRVVVAHIRSHGYNVIMFLDDGIGGENNYSEAEKSSNFVRFTLLDFGFLLAEEKCSWIPSLRAKWLGHEMDFEANKLYITEDRICRLVNSLELVLKYIEQDRYNLIPVRSLASVTGQIISLHSVVGNGVRLKTREIYNCILSRASWNAPVIITGGALDELRYWKDNVQVLNATGRSFDQVSYCEYSLFSDASGEGYGGYLLRNTFLGKNDHDVAFVLPEAGSMASIIPSGVKLPEESVSFDEISQSCEANITQTVLPEVSVSFDEICQGNELNITQAGLPFASPCQVAGVSDTIPRHSERSVYDLDNQVTGCWNAEEISRSSTWREAEAVRRVMKSYFHILKNCSVKIYSDNKNVKSILKHGSSKNDLQVIASDINDFCVQNCIKISPEWVPRAENQLADHLSRCQDSDDWYISNDCFKYLDYLWGRHTVDRFASYYNNKCSRFNSKWWVPNTEGVNAFDQLWSAENNWIVPPPRLIMFCLKKLESEKAFGTLIVPKWSSAPFWSFLCDSKGNYKQFITDVRYLSKVGVVCKGKGNNGIFERVPLPFDLLALKIVF